VLYHTHREVTKKDFNSEMELERTIRKQMELEKVITDCKGLPYLLIKVAEKLSKGHELWKIMVEKQGGDFLHATKAHSRAKRKELIVKVRKEKNSERGRLSNRPSPDEEISSANKSKGKSKDKTILKATVSKNAKRKERTKLEESPKCDLEESEGTDNDFNFFSSMSKSEVTVPSGGGLKDKAKVIGASERMRDPNMFRISKQKSEIPVHRFGESDESLSPAFKQNPGP